jgi:tRNA 2-thiouridine synthesizing protein A
MPRRPPWRRQKKWRIPALPGNTLAIRADPISVESVSSETVDARYLLCPLPVIRTQDRVARLRTGDAVRVFCTDPGVFYGIPSWCRVYDRKVCEISRQSDEIKITIRLGDSK